MQVGFWFFDQEQSQLGILGVLKLHNDGCDEDQVGVAEARFG
jgi:hypothetical protein